TALLNYHFTFHSKRLAEMAWGDFSHWDDLNSYLQGKYFVGHPHLHPEKPMATYAGSESSKNVAYLDFNYQKCS
ncbi:hypothetical protein BU17DRAFT_55418, partial [Hysterangium stoloniferum]